MQLMLHIQHRRTKLLHRRGSVVVERSPRMREIGVRSPVGTNLIDKTGSDSSYATRLATGASVMGPHYKQMPRVTVGSAR